MTKRQPVIRRTVHRKPILWLPIDSRVLPDILRFNKVSGLARVFLFLEIVMASLVVIGSVGLAMLTVVSR